MAVPSEKAYELAQAMTRLFMFFKPKKNINNMKPIKLMVLKTISIVLKENNNVVTPTRICEILGLSKSALTAVLNSLEKSGYIERNLSKDDRRMILISMTDAAVKFMDECHLSLQSSFFNLAEYLGEDDTEKLIELLKRTQDFLAK